MDRRVFLSSAIAIAATTRRAGSQNAAKASTIGWLTAQQAPSLAPFLDAFRSGLPSLAIWSTATLRSNIAMATTTSCVLRRWRSS